MHYIPRFRQYIENNGTRLEKLKQVKEFMFNEFYIKRAIEKEAVHDADLELFAIQKAQEKENQFGQRVQKNLIIPPNVVVKASKSGKSSGEKHHPF